MFTENEIPDLIPTQDKAKGQSVQSVASGCKEAVLTKYAKESANNQMKEYTATKWKQK